jgi:hypothetical protein
MKASDITMQAAPAQQIRIIMVLLKKYDKTADIVLFNTVVCLVPSEYDIEFSFCRCRVFVMYSR